MPAKTKPAGLCRQCKKRPARPGHTRCEECAGLESLARKRLYWRRVSQGSCSHCGKVKEPARQDKRMCQPCAEVMAVRLLERYNRLKAAGRCASCNKHPAWQGQVHCLKCWRKKKKRRTQESTP
jgi:hypothetical protein